MTLGDMVRRLLGRGGNEVVGDRDDESMGPERPDEVDRDRVRQLVQHAVDDRVTASLLAGSEGYTEAPPAAYLDADETVAYALIAGRLWFGENITVRADDVPIKRTIVLVTDQRILLVVGKRRTDNVWGIPMESIDLVNVKYGDREAYLVVEAEHEGSAKTFFLELHDPIDEDRYRALARYCNGRRPGETRDEPNGDAR
jgi:hypothetical protein